MKPFEEFSDYSMKAPNSNTPSPPGTMHHWFEQPGVNHIIKYPGSRDLLKNPKLSHLFDKETGKFIGIAM